MGLDEYETRSWAGWHHHVAMCLLGGAFLLGLQQDWGEKMPRITRPQVYRVVREMLPWERVGPHELLLWLNESQLRNERAAAPTRNAALPAVKTGWSRHPKRVVVVLVVSQLWNRKGKGGEVWIGRPGF